jgi:hypothetical protein
MWQHTIKIKDPLESIGKDVKGSIVTYPQQKQTNKI